MAALSDGNFGSSVRAKGILLEIRARLPAPLRKPLRIVSRVITLRVPQGVDADVAEPAAIVSKSMQDVGDLPVIPREVEEILAISAGERHCWLKDGRLQSAGTRNVKFRGRARKVIFHVFDPRQMEDVLTATLSLSGAKKMQREPPRIDGGCWEGCLDACAKERPCGCGFQQHWP